MSEELVALALFDDDVDIFIKDKIVAAMITVDRVDLGMLQNKTLAEFATKNSAVLFKKLRLSEDFLKVGSDQWNNKTSFKTSKEFVSTLAVTNDNAERCVALVQEF